MPDLPHFTVTRFIEPIGFTGGFFGVCLFFLISGFVIPFSLERLGPGRFLLQRTFRLYPTYAVGLALTCLALALYASTHGIPFRIRLIDYLKNVSLCRDWLRGTSIDGIVWTLEVELKFYLICAAIGTVSSLRSGTAILLPMALLTLVCCTADFTPPALLPLSVLVVAAPFLPFMFLGTCIYNLQHRHWSFGKACLVGSILATAASVNFFQVQKHFGLPVRYFFANCGLALAGFALAYRYQNCIPYSRVLNWLAEISYPLYVVHGFAGDVLLSVLTDAGCPPYPAIGLTMATSIGVAYLVHLGVEIPSLKLGKWVLARVT